MSNKKRTQKKAKQAKRANQRAARAHKKPRSRGHVAHDIVASAAEALLSGDPVDAEIIASEVMASVLETRMRLSPDEQADLPSLARAVVQLLTEAFTGRGVLNDAALALTYALWSMDLTDMELSSECALLAERLKAEGAQPPEWSADIGAYSVTESWSLRDVWCGQQDVVIGLRDARGNEHSVSALCVQDAGFQIGEINVSAPIGEFVQKVTSSLATDPARELTVLERIPDEHAALLIDAALDATMRENAELLLETDMGMAHLGLLKSRWARLAKPDADAWDVWEKSPLHSELDALEVHDLQRRLWMSAEREAEPAATRAACDELADWVAASGACVWFAQFGPDQVEEFLLDHAAPGAYGDPDLASRTAATMAAVRAWAHIANGVAGLGDAAVSAVLDTIADLVEPFGVIARGEAEEADQELDEGEGELP